MNRNKEAEKKLRKELNQAKLSAKPGEHELVIILDHLKAGFNIGKILRTAEVFSINSVHIIGTKFFDPYPAKGALKRIPVVFYDSIKNSFDELKSAGYEIFVLDTNTKTFLHKATLPKKCAMVFGHEELGPMLDGIDPNLYSKVKIKQFGQIESLNVSIAASLGIYEYLRQTTLN